MKKYHYVYEIKNLINEKIYIGVHTTYNIDDDYMGSGLLIRRAVKKYGRTAFEKTILAVFNTRGEANKFEAELVTDEFVLNEQTYNLAIGNDSSTCTCITTKGKIWVHSDTENKYIDQQYLSKYESLGFKKGRNIKIWDEATIKRYVNRQSGNKNKIAISNDILTKYIEADEIGDYVSAGWKVCQKITTHPRSSKNKICINNGSRNKYISEHELDQFISMGYTKGRVKHKSQIPKPRKKITNCEILRRNKILDQYAFKEINWKSKVHKLWGAKTKIKVWTKKHYPKFYEEYWGPIQEPPKNKKITKKQLAKQLAKQQRITKKKQLAEQKAQLIKEKKRTKSILIEKQRQLILTSDIDFSKFGWVKEVAKLLNKLPQKINKWMKDNMEEFYNETCFKRK